MSTINHDNYEAFYLDYIEGNLDAQVTAQLLLFLENNPEFKVDLEEFELVPLPTTSFKINDKSQLKKEINQHSIDEYIMADIDGILPIEDHEELAALVSSNPENNALYHRYTKTKLIPPTVHFQNKEKLKKRGAVIYYLIPTAIAAALLLLLLSWPKTPISETKNINLVESTNQKEHLQQPEKQHSSGYEHQNKNDIRKADKSTNNNKIDSSVPLNDKPNVAKETFGSKDYLSISVEDTAGPHQIDKFSNEATYEEVTAIDIDTIPIEDIELTPEEPLESIASNNDEILTIKEWLTKTVRKKLLRNESPTAQRIESNELLAAVSERLDNGTKTDISYNYGPATSQERQYLRIRIGKFEFYRTKRK